MQNNFDKNLGVLMPNPFDQFCVITDVIDKTNGLISENKIRHLIRHRDKHAGFERCVKKVGKEWIVNLPQLISFIANDQKEDV